MSHLRIIEDAEATGELRVAYDFAKQRPMPAVYRAPHGGPAGIIRAHSLDPTLLRLAFTASGTNGVGPLSWADRELLAATASRVNQCVY